MVGTCGKSQGPWLDYDWSGLLKLERLKISRMLKCQEKPCGFEYEGQEQVIRDMKICLSLIDIVLQEDPYFISYISQYREKIEMTVDEESGILEVFRNGAGDVKIPVHVNTNNISRFGFPREYKPKTCSLMDVRQVKALYLYNKIRNRILNWWI